MARSAEGRVYIVGDTRGLSRALRSAESQTQRFSKKMGAIGGQMKSVGKTMTLGVTAPIVGGMALSVKAASDLGESVNAVNVTFGKSAKGILQLGKEASRSVGLSAQQFNGLAVQFSSFASTVAGPGGDVVKTMDDLTTRAADFASVMNIDVAEAARLFQSGLAGESEPLRKFGIDVSAAAVESYAYANGIAQSGKKLTEAQKVQARYGLIMQQTAKTQGDFANTSDSLANRTRILKADLTNLAADIGTALVPIIEDVAAAAQKVIGWFTKLSSTQKKAIVVVLALVAAIGPLLSIVGTVIGIIGALAASVTIAGTTMTVFGAIIAALTSPITIVIAAIAAIVVALVILYKKNDTARKIITKAWEIIKKVGAAVWSALKKALGLYWADMKMKFALMKAAFNGLKKAFNSIVGVAKSVWSKVSGAFRSGYINTVAWINKMIDKLNWLLGKIGVAKIPSVTTGTAPKAGTGTGYGAQEKRGDSIFGTGRKPGTGDASGIYSAVTGDLWGMLSRVLPDMPALPPVLAGVPKAIIEKVKKYVRGLFSGGGGLGAVPGGPGYAWAYALAKRFGLTVTSTFRPGAITASGNMSNHGIYGKAADFAGPAARMMALANALFGNPAGFSEIIYQHRGYSRGSNYYFPRNDHFDHVHVARGDSSRGSGMRPSSGTSLNVNVVMPGGSTIIGTSSEVARILAPMISREVSKQTARANRRR